MLIGVRNNCIQQGETLEEKMRIVKAIGYDFLELTVALEQTEEARKEISRYQAATASSGLPILHTSMPGFNNYAVKSPEERAAVVAGISAGIQFTKDLGADSILLPTRHDPAENLNAYADIYRKELQAVADQAAEAGVTLALEHVGDYKPFLLAKLVQEIDHPAVRMYFDMGNCFYVGEDPLEQARICAPFAAHLHIKGGPVAPLAAMPLVAIREILEEAGFSGRGCLELAPFRNDLHLTEAKGLLKMAGYWQS